MTLRDLLRAIGTAPGTAPVLVDDGESARGARYAIVAGSRDVTGYPPGAIVIYAPLGIGRR
jgi:hypothetical protein